jgi:hypothetical protein
MSMRFAAAVAAILISAHGAGAQTQEKQAPRSPTWTKQSYVTDRFEVEFSGPIEVTRTDMDAKTESLSVRSTNYMQSNPDLTYMVVVTLYKFGLKFENGYKASFGSLKCKTTTIDNAMSFDNGSARELAGTDCTDDLEILARYYGTGKWFFQVLAIFNKDGGDRAAARHFVESFRVTGN